MRKISHILFPVDLSARCEAARPVVEAWARQFNAKVTLLHTIQIPISSYGGPDGYPIVIDIPSIEATAKARLERFQLDIPSVERISGIGDPAYEIIQYAAKNDVDLIMMPTHGYGTFRSLLLGSTAAKVLHDAQCPVWTSAHLEEIPTAARTVIHNILCAVEAGAEAEALIRSAKELALAWGAKLRLVHAVAPGENPADLSDSGLEITIEKGEVSKVVHEAVLAFQADLVVTGGGKLHETFGRLRTNTYAIIRESPCPVLSM
jgi:nucleotide-binding universal stress UspA family protein